MEPTNKRRGFAGRLSPAGMGRICWGGAFALGAVLAVGVPVLLATPLRGVRFETLSDWRPSAQADGVSSHGQRWFASTAQLSASLDKYDALPRAKLRVLAQGVGEDEDGDVVVPSSYALPDGGLECDVTIIEDAAGRGALEMRWDEYAQRSEILQAEARPAHRAAMNEFEALHELGHCAQAALGRRFHLPGLSKADSKAIDNALNSRGASGANRANTLFREMFADAYASVRFLRAHQGTGRADALATLGEVRRLRLIDDWKTTGGVPDPKLPDGVKLRLADDPLRDGHATESVIAKVLASPDAYLAMDPEQAASLLASQAIASRCAQIPKTRRALAYLMDLPESDWDDAPMELLRGAEGGLARAWLAATALAEQAPAPHPHPHLLAWRSGRSSVFPEGVAAKSPRGREPAPSSKS